MTINITQKYEWDPDTLSTLGDVWTLSYLNHTPKVKDIENTLLPTIKCDFDQCIYCIHDAQNPNPKYASNVSQLSSNEITIKLHINQLNPKHYIPSHPHTHNVAILSDKHVPIDHVTRVDNSNKCVNDCDTYNFADKPIRNPINTSIHDTNKYNFTANPIFGCQCVKYHSTPITYKYL